MPTVTEVLDRRRLNATARRRFGGVLGAALLHAIVIAAAFLLPRLMRRAPAPVEYVAVKLMPAPAARAAAATPRAAPTPAPRPAATPEPKPAEPETPPPPEESRPVVPDPSSRRPPTAARETAPAPRPRATPEAASGGGSGGSAASATASIGGFDNPSFTYGYYVDRMLALIRAQWSRPPLGGDLELIVNFRIAADGSVLNARVVQSSGYNAFDLAGLRAVQSATPLPPLPRSFREESIGVHLIFR